MPRATGRRCSTLRLPAALPFIFNALKINTTLAMIGAIVAEFFGTPTVGMGFRISTEVGHLGIDMVWATIVVAALTGSLFYALVAGDRAPRDVLARVLPSEGGLSFALQGDRAAIGAMQVEVEDRSNEEVTVCIRQRGGDPRRGRGARGRQGDAAAQMGHAGAVRRLLRRQGQGLLQGRGPRRDDQAGRPGRRARAGARRRRRRRRRRLDAGGARRAREGRADGQHRPAVQALRPRAHLPRRHRHQDARPTSRAARSASGSTATNIRSSTGWASSASRPTARPAASRC